MTTAQRPRRNTAQPLNDVPDHVFIQDETGAVRVRTQVNYERTRKAPVDFRPRKEAAELGRELTRRERLGKAR